MYKLKEIYIDKIKKDTLLQGKIANATGKKVITILRWADDNSEYLTMANVLAVISEHTGDPVSELTELVKAEA